MQNNIKFEKISIIDNYTLEEFNINDSLAIFLFITKSRNLIISHYVISLKVNFLIK